MRLHNINLARAWQAKHNPPVAKACVICGAPFTVDGINHNQRKSCGRPECAEGMKLRAAGQKKASRRRAQEKARPRERRWA